VMLPLDEVGDAGFLAGLRRCGCEPIARNGIVVFTVVPVGGAHAGCELESGVASTELASWPSCPPHWVHLPASVTIAITNAQTSTIPGWLMHSRQILRWGNAADPVQAWLAHVRAVLEEA
jgi:hypothetical protein